MINFIMKNIKVKTNFICINNYKSIMTLLDIDAPAVTEREGDLNQYIIYMDYKDFKC